MTAITILLIGVGAVFLLYVLSIYNGLKQQEVKVEQSLSSIETYLEERFDTLTKMVASVNEESKRESDLQKELTLARQGLSNKDNLEGMKEAHEAMSRLYVQMENYPTTQFNEGFRQLQRSIVTIEDKLSAARRAYNAQVTRFNQKVVTFPNSIIAEKYGFETKAFFTVTEHKREDVDMQDLFAK